jgi:site-specific recombinase XerD
MLLNEAIDELCIATLADDNSPRTVRDYREKLGHLVDFLGNVEVEQITVSDLRRYVVDMKSRSTIYDNHPTRRSEVKALSPFTVAGRVRVMKRLFNFLVQEGWLERSPAERIKTPNPKRTKPKGITHEDFLTLIKSTRGDEPVDKRDLSIELLLYDTGCRIGGLCGLTMDDIDLETRRATVREKGDKTRFVFFEEQTEKALVDWLAVRPQDKGPWLFTSFGKKSDRLTERGVSHMLNRRAKRAGITGPSNPHSFRHGFAIHYLMDGGDMGSLSDTMGHTDIAITKKSYGIYTVEQLQEKHRRHSPIAKLDDADLGWE